MLSGVVNTATVSIAFESVRGVAGHRRFSCSLNDRERERAARSPGLLAT